jgi:hypothetical protein
MIPRRLDRLPWSRWHWLVVVGLGITWILDGFEVTLVGAIASMLSDPDALALSTQQSASAGTFYLFGAISGALVFGYRKALEDIASPYTAVRGRGPSAIAAPAPAS